MFNKIKGIREDFTRVVDKTARVGINRVSRAVLAVTLMVSGGCQKIANDLWDENRCPVSETRGNLHAISPLCPAVSTRDAGNDTDTSDADAGNDTDTSDADAGNDTDTGDADTGNDTDTSDADAGNDTDTSDADTRETDTSCTDTNDVCGQTTDTCNLSTSSYFYNTYREQMIAISNRIANSVTVTPASLDYIDRFLHALDHISNNPASNDLSVDAYIKRFVDLRPEMEQICLQIVADLQVKAPHMITPPNVTQKYCEGVIAVR